MIMGYETVLMEKIDGIAVITLNRPDKLNAVNKQMRSEVLALLDEMESDDGVRVLVFTGSGRGFCAGADISEFEGVGKDPQLESGRSGDLLLMPKRIFGFEKPIIGAINGVAAGDGAQWVLAFDLNVASERARFGWPATGLGIL